MAKKDLSERTQFWNCEAKRNESKFRCKGDFNKLNLKGLRFILKKAQRLIQHNEKQFRTLSKPNLFNVLKNKLYENNIYNCNYNSADKFSASPNTQCRFRELDHCWNLRNPKSMGQYEPGNCSNGHFYNPKRKSGSFRQLFYQTYNKGCGWYCYARHHSQWSSKYHNLATQIRVCIY